MKIKVLFGCLVLLAASSAARAQSKADGGMPPKDLPSYKVDASWPKPLPNHWIVGQIGGLTVDKDDHIWVYQRPRSLTADESAGAANPPTAECCVPAPSVLEFDTQGNLLKSWGGPGYTPNFPVTEHGILVDKAGNVWLTGSGRAPRRGAADGAAAPAPEDREVLEFTNDGKLIKEIGHPAGGAENNQDTSMLGSPAGMEIDEAAHELYVADGYGNRRIVVYDTDSGAFKRGWGAYGIPLAEIDNGQIPPYNPADPPAKQFLGPVHCVHISMDNFVYVCDRTADRIQIFTKQGKFVKEFFVAPKTMRNGSIWTINFSHDPQQKYLLVGDGANQVVWILNRADGTVLGSFGEGGRNAGQFHWVHQAGMDSKGNLYTGEVDTGKRVQKFVLQTK